MSVSPIRVGLIGCGNVALGEHLPAYHALVDDFRVVAIADPTPDRRQRARELAELSDDDAHADALELIGRPDIDMVDLCTPQHVRRDLIIAAARAGKHVLAEKPLAAIPKDASAIVAAARENGICIGVVHNFLLLPEVVRTLELIARDEIGPVEVVILNWLGVADEPGTSSYRPRWRHDPRQSGGGVLMDMLHVVYLAEALLGRRIERVSAYVTARTGRSAVEELALCRFETDSNAALVNVGWGVGPGGFVVSGPDGRIEVKYRDGGSGIFAPFDRLICWGQSGRHEVTKLNGLPAIRGVIADFAAAVREGRDPLASGEQGIRTLQATVAAYASAALGRTVRLPLEPGDPVYEDGVAGLAGLEVPEWAPIRRRRLFGCA